MPEINDGFWIFAIAWFGGVFAAASWHMTGEALKWWLRRRANRPRTVGERRIRALPPLSNGRHEPRDFGWPR